MNPAEFANIARAEEHFWWYRGMLRILTGLLDPIAHEHKFQHVLEGGCGTGYLSKVLEQRYGWPMYALDLGWEGLEYAHEMGVRRPLQGDIAQLPFPDASFDAVLSMDVIVHFPPGEEMRAFHELARVLQPGGWMILRTSALDILRSRHSEFAHERQRFTRRRLLECTNAAGIQTHRCTYINSLLLPVALAKFRIWEPLTRLPATSGVEPVSPLLDKLLFAPLAVESVCLRNNINFPVGQTLLFIGHKRY